MDNKDIRYIPSAVMGLVVAVVSSISFDGMLLQIALGLATFIVSYFICGLIPKDLEEEGSNLLYNSLLWEVSRWDPLEKGTWFRYSDKALKRVAEKMLDLNPGEAVDKETILAGDGTEGWAPRIIGDLRIAREGSYLRIERGYTSRNGSIEFPDLNKEPVRYRNQRPPKHRTSDIEKLHATIQKLNEEILNYSEQLLNSEKEREALQRQCNRQAALVYGAKCDKERLVGELAEVESKLCEMYL